MIIIIKDNLIFNNYEIMKLLIRIQKILEELILTKIYRIINKNKFNNIPPSKFEYTPSVSKLCKNNKKGNANTYRSKYIYF